MKDFFGNAQAAATLRGMIESERIPQTILLAGPEGVGKSTLVRRFAQLLLPDAASVEHDDLSLPENAATIADREKWTADKRSADPLLFASHPDFVTFPPDGPLRQISIQQMRELKERAGMTQAFWGRFQHRTPSGAAMHEINFLRESLHGLRTTVEGGIRSAIMSNDADTLRRIRLAVERLQSEIRGIITENATSQQPAGAEGEDAPQPAGPVEEF